MKYIQPLVAAPTGCGSSTSFDHINRFKDALHEFLHRCATSSGWRRFVRHRSRGRADGPHRDR
ncbi:MAG: hypothetical protein R3F43_22565 [bacterium]